MIKQAILEKIKKTTQEFFQKMGFETEIEFLPQNDDVLPIQVKAEDPQILIGDRGETLFEIQHLLKIVLKRKAGIEGLFYIDLDINDYKKKKINYLKEMARSLAEEVVLTKKEKILPIMSAYERRIIHLELADRQDITTQSIGEEPERRIVIRPYL